MIIIIVAGIIWFRWFGFERCWVPISSHIALLRENVCAIGCLAVVVNRSDI